MAEDAGGVDQGQGRTRRATAWARTLALFGIRSAASSQIAAGVNKGREVAVRAAVAAGLIGGSLALAAAGTLALSESARERTFAQPDGVGADAGDLAALREQVEDVRAELERTGATDGESAARVEARADEIADRTRAVAEATVALDQAVKDTQTVAAADREAARREVAKAERALAAAVDALQDSTAALAADLDVVRTAGEQEAEARAGGDAAVLAESRRAAEALAEALNATEDRLRAADAVLAASLDSATAALAAVDAAEASARASGDAAAANASAALSERLDGTVARLDGLAGSVASVQADVAALASRVTGLADSLSALDTRVDDLERRIEAEEQESPPPPVVIGDPNKDAEQDARLSALEARPQPGERQGGQNNTYRTEPGATNTWGQYIYSSPAGARALVHTGTLSFVSLDGQPLSLIVVPLLACADSTREGTPSYARDAGTAVTVPLAGLAGGPASSCTVSYRIQNEGPGPLRLLTSAQGIGVAG